MKFQKTLNKEYFDSLQESLIIANRKKLWENNKQKLDYLREQLFDLYDIETIFVINEFLEKNIYNINKIPILIETNKNNFEDIVESCFVQNIVSDFDFYFLVEDILYFFDKDWREVEKEIEKQVSINE